MARKYDYTDPEFALRIKLRRDIMTLNRTIAGIQYSIGYPGHAAIYISEKYYNMPRPKIVENLAVGVNPIDFLNSKALYHYRDYLNDIVSHWQENKLRLTKFSPADFSTTIEKCADVARTRAKLDGALPLDNQTTKLPKNITEAMIKKVDVTLKAANILDTEFDDTYTKTRSTRKPASKKYTTIKQEDIKQAVKDAVVELIDMSEEKLAELSRDLIAVLPHKSELEAKTNTTITLFNYKDYVKENNSEITNTDNNTLHENEVEKLETEIAKRTAFIRKIIAPLTAIQSQEEQLRILDYRDTHLRRDIKELKELKKELNELKTLNLDKDNERTM